MEKNKPHNKTHGHSFEKKFTTQFTFKNSLAHGANRSELAEDCRAIEQLFKVTYSLPEKTHSLERQTEQT